MNNCYYYDEKNQLLVIKFYVQPAAKKTEIVGIYNESIKCKLSAPPFDGKANSELVKFLKKLLKISNINIISGLTSREKKLAINIDKTQIDSVINILIPQISLDI